MSELIMESFGKINLALDILYKRTDNYHEIRSIMQSISLKDTLRFRNLEENRIIIESNNHKIPLDSDNLVHKAWEKMKEVSGLDRGVYVYIEKNIPLGAGLAGGSANAATCLKALNTMWDLNYPLEKLIEIGAEIGADVPFCLMGGTALAEGIGEKLTSIRSFKDKNVLLCNPGIEVSSAYAYSILELEDERLDIDGLRKCIDEENITCIYDKMANKMEKPIIEKHPIIDEIKNIMDKSGCNKSLMSGSGSTVFGFFEDKAKLIDAEKKLLQISNRVYRCKTM